MASVRQWWASRQQATWSRRELVVLWTCAETKGIPGWELSRVTGLSAARCQRVVTRLFQLGFLAQQAEPASPRTTGRRPRVLFSTTTAGARRITELVAQLSRS